MDDLDAGQEQPVCWRCGLPVETGVLGCPHCSAPLWNAIVAAPDEPPRKRRRHDPVTAVFIAYALLLLVSLVHGAVSGSSNNLFIPDASVRPEAACWRMAACEAIDTAIVLGCWWYIGRLPVPRRPSRASRTSAWIAAVPVLGLMLAANHGYHVLLRDFIRFPIHYVDMVDASPHLWTRWLLVVCVQPAIVEELFFRGLAFRVLLPHLSGGGTVMITSVAFGLAHIHAPLSVPVLVGLGAVNGCAALMTGRLWLPMLLHFVHNLAVTLMGWYL